MCRSLLVLPHPLREGPGARWSPQHLPQASGACATVRAPATGRPAGLRPSGFRLPASVSRRSLRSSVERVHVPQTGELRSGQGPPRPRAAVCGRAPGQLRWALARSPCCRHLCSRRVRSPALGLAAWACGDTAIVWPSGTSRPRASVQQASHRAERTRGVRPVARGHGRGHPAGVVLPRKQHELPGAGRGLRGLGRLLGVPLMAPERGF